MKFHHDDLEEVSKRNDPQALVKPELATVQPLQDVREYELRHVVAEDGPGEVDEVEEEDDVLRRARDEDQEEGKEEEEVDHHEAREGPREAGEQGVRAVEVAAGDDAGVLRPLLIAVGRGGERGRERGRSSRGRTDARGIDHDQVHVGGVWLSIEHGAGNGFCKCKCKGG